MRQELHEPGQPELYYYVWHPLALALAGDREAAIAMLQRRVASNFEPALALLQLELEPGFAGLRQDPRVQSMMSQIRSYLAGQRRELDRLRAEGVVPDRSKAAPPAG
jgi:hypothetical protein